MTRAVPILMYHSVDDHCAPGYRRWCVSPKRFAGQMARLKELQCTALTISELVARMDNDTLPERAVAITFDDGMYDFADHALPVLCQFNYPATLFVTTSYVGKTAKWLAPLGEGEIAESYAFFGTEDFQIGYKAFLAKENISLHDAVGGMNKFPQVMINVPLQGSSDPMQSAAVQQAVEHAEGKLDGRGRVLLRPSGTEPLIRVMVEGEDELLVSQLANDIAAQVESAAQAA